MIKSQEENGYFPVSPEETRKERGRLGRKVTLGRSDGPRKCLGAWRPRKQGEEMKERRPEPGPRETASARAGELAHGEMAGWVKMAP